MLITIQEKIQELLADLASKDCANFYLVVLDKKRPAFFVDAFKVNVTTHTTLPLKSVTEYHQNSSKANSTKYNFALRPSVHIYDEDESQNVLIWNLNRGKKRDQSQQRIVIRQKRLLGGPVFFYNMGESEITIGYRDDHRIKHCHFQPFIVPSGEIGIDTLNPSIFYDPVEILRNEYFKIVRG